MTRETNPLLENPLFPELTGKSPLENLLSMKYLSVIPGEQDFRDPWNLLDMLRW